MARFTRDLLNVLEKRITGKRQFIQVIAGPRQVGKTTVVRQLLAKNLLFAKDFAADGVLGADGRWLDIIWEQTITQMKLSGAERGLLVIDEIQKISNWSEYVKKNWDEDSKNEVNLHVIILGSSRLLLQQGLSESLLGRFEFNYLGHWSFTEMRQAFNFTPEKYVWFGGYPAAADLADDEERFKNYIRGSVIDASLNQDVLALTRIHKPALLARLFDFAAAYSSQILSFTKILGQLQESGNTTTLADYLRLLNQAGLVTGLDTYSPKLTKTRASSPKFQVHNTALIAANTLLTFAQAQTDPAFWGRLAESAIGAHLLTLTSQNTSAKLYYWREGDNEVDFVLQNSERVVGIEVKSKAGERTPIGLTKFSGQFPGAKTILIGSDGWAWQDFLLLDLKEMFGGGIQC